MERFLLDPIDLKNFSPLTLAFIGDGVYELFVREFMVLKGNCPVKKLHANTVEMVRCEFQAKIAKEKLMPHFTDEELGVFLRGRNAKVAHVPKNAAVADYHAATALECLFGYLYLQGNL
ncbi:MAG: ribonuclease III domain-containing protein, partial [Oscillospiraceae bacterium]